MSRPFSLYSARGHSAHSQFVFKLITAIINSHFLIIDPFAEDEGKTKGTSGTDGYIHIRIQQRNGRKTLTTVQGINPEFDLKKIVKVAKKVNKPLNKLSVFSKYKPVSSVHA